MAGFTSYSMSDAQMCTDNSQSLLAQFGGYIQGYSRPKLNLTFDNGGQSSRIDIVVTRNSDGKTIYRTNVLRTASQTTFNGTFEAGSGLVESAGAYTMTCNGTFAGTTYTVTMAYTVLAYAEPSVSTFALTRYKYRSGSGYIAAPDGGYIWMTIAASAQAMTGGSNATTLEYYFNGTWTAITTGSNGLSYSLDERNVKTPSNAVYRGTVSTGSDCAFKLRVTDKVTTATVTAVAKADGAYFSVEKYGVAVGKRSAGTSSDKKFEVASGYATELNGNLEVSGASTFYGSATLYDSTNLYGDVTVDGNIAGQPTFTDGAVFSGNVSFSAIREIFPVGAVYISTSSSNPSAYFGGSWQQFGQGRVLIGAGTGTDSNGASRYFSSQGTGGEYNHTLTIDEMPAHNHSFDTGGVSVASGSKYNRVHNASSYSANHTYQSTPRGGGQAHNNLPPYIGVYMWVRTS